MLASGSLLVIITLGPFVVFRRRDIHGINWITNICCSTPAGSFSNAIIILFRLSPGGDSQHVP